MIPFYLRFIKKFPTAQRLAEANLSEVLKSWQGLGYNRRAKLLREAAQQLICTPSFGTRFNLIIELEKLSGVGPYTARAIAAFAYNQDTNVIETNIRTVVIHHFFPNWTEKVSDVDIADVLARVLPKGKSREWYSALMDYGAYLKRSGVSHNAQSKMYAKQSKFAGSPREARGAILRVLMASELGLSSRQLFARVEEVVGASRREQIVCAIDTLHAEGLIQKKRGHYALAD